MRKIKNVIFILVFMTLISIACLLIISAFAYIYKWQADKALIGITVTYIMAGFIGGFSKKIIEKEQKSIGQKMLEGMLMASVFMGGLMVLSVFVAQNPLEISSRFLMIWMLLIGSTCLGRIL